MDKISQPYQSIGCSYYDQLEAYATGRTRCSIVYTMEGAEHAVDGVIADLFAKEGAEYMRLDGGTVIRLDHIVSVNGIKLNYAC